MTWSLERQYRFFLFTYPAEYRAARGDELVTTAVEMGRPGQRLPQWREAGGFIVGGLRTRSRLARTGSIAMTWADGLRLGAAIVLALSFAGQVNNLLFTTALQPRLMPAAMIALIVALLRAPRRVWAVFAAAGLVLTWSRITGLWALATNPHSPLHTSVTPMVLVANILPWVVPFVLAGAALLWQPRRRRRPAVSPWWFVGLLIVVPSFQVLKGVSTTLTSVPSVAMTMNFIQLLWPLPVLAVGYVTREIRLSFAVAVWSVGSLLVNSVGLVAILHLGVAWLFDPALFAVVWLLGGLAVTALIDRRLVRL